MLNGKFLKDDQLVIYILPEYLNYSSELSLLRMTHFALFSVGRESGMIHRYSLPNIALINRYSLGTRPHRYKMYCKYSVCKS